MSELERIARALEGLLEIGRAREARRRAPRPKREKPAVQAEDRAKGRAMLRRLGVR